MSTFNVNGKVYSGNNITVVNGKVFIDGKLANEEQVNEKIVNIKLTAGDNSNITIEGCSTIQLYGNINSLRTGSGDIEVFGNCQNVQTGSGDVDFETLTEGGSVKTGSGDITYKKIKQK